jgi:hypothetical protein
MPRIFDCVLLTDELDLLEARFREYESIPGVTHVIAEAPVTHQGGAKPLHFWENRLDRFAGWHGRWTHVRAEPHELPAGADPRARKNALRDYLAHGYSGGPDDIILHGGIDEIPAAWAVAALAAGTIPLPVALEMRWCAYRADLVHPGQWQGTVAQARKDAGSFTSLRESRTALPVLVSAGTRLSMMGGSSRVLASGAVSHPDGQALRDAVPDETWPRWVREGGCPAAWLAAPPGPAP